MAGVKKNFAYQSIYQVTTIILPLITSPYVARVLGAEKIGIYSYTYAIAYYFSLVALLGINNHGNRVIAGVRDNPQLLKQTFSELLFVHCFIAGIAVIAYYVYFFCFVGEDRLCAAIQGLWVIASFFDVSWLFFGLEKFKLTVIRSTVVKIMITISVFLFVHQKEDIWIYCLIMAGGTFISQVILWPFIRQYLDLKTVTLSGARKHIRPLLILFIPAIAVSLYKYMDKIMLGIMTTKLQVGFYENAERAINIPISIIGAFGTVMLPKMSNLAAKGDDKQSNRYIAISMEFVMCLTCAMAFGMAAVANKFSVVFWGNEFIECGGLIQVLCISVVFVAFANILRMQYLIPQKMDSAFIVSVFTGAIVNLIVNYLLIGKYAARGAAIGTVAAELSVCVVQAFWVRKKLPIRTYIKTSFPFVVFGTIMYIAVRIIGNVVTNVVIALLVQIFVGAVLFCMLCFVYFRKTGNQYFNSMLEQLNCKLKKEI